MDSGIPKTGAQQMETAMTWNACKARVPSFLRGLAAAAAMAAALPFAAASAQVLSDAQRATWTAAFQALDTGRPGDAVAIAAGLGDALGQKIVTWLALADDRYAASPRDLMTFVINNPHWPRLNTLQRRAERAIGANEPPTEIASWFQLRQPLTPDGWIAYVSALQALGMGDRAVAAARTGWREGEFDATGQSKFLSIHGRLLTAEDHQARVDRLLWAGENDAAERMLPLLDSGWQALVRARLKLARGESGVDAAIAAVPAALLSDPGLVYQRLRFRRQAELDEGARELLAVAPVDPAHASQWWQERGIIVRRLIRDARFADAYQLAADHRLTGGVEYMDAEMIAGWLALRRLNNPRAALDHFMRLYAQAETPISVSRGAYWAGRALAAMGDNGAARQWYGIAAQFTQTFYGQLAAAELDPAAPLVLPAGPAPVTPEEMAAFRNDEIVRAVLLMQALSREEFVTSFTWALMNMSGEPRHLQQVAALATEMGRLDLAVWAARQAGRTQTVLYDGYPVLSLPAGLAPVDPALVHGIIRQESGFDVDAISSAGARGLMQLMPQTAETVARSLGIPHSTAMLTTDVAHNLRLGTTYLHNRISEFGGSYIMAIAGYNAGPNRVRSWIETYGDPRAGAVDPIDWIELIPFSETRNYVQRVLEGTQLYRVRLGQAPTNGSILADLGRGGS